MLTDLLKTRSELWLQKAEVRRLAGAMRCLLPVLDVAAIAGIAAANKERISLVQAAATITRDDVDKWEGVHGKYPSKQNYEGLRSDIESKGKRLPEYVKCHRRFARFLKLDLGGRWASSNLSRESFQVKNRLRR